MKLMRFHTLVKEERNLGDANADIMRSYIVTFQKTISLGLLLCQITNEKHRAVIFIVIKN